MIAPPRVVIPEEYYLLHRIFTPLNQFPTFFLIFLYQILIVVQGVRLCSVVNNMQLFPKENFLVGMVYILFTAMLPDWNNITGALIINTLFIEIIGQFKRLSTLDKPEKAVFNLSFFTGIAIIIYPPSIIWALLILIACISLARFKIHHILVWLIGLLLPFYFLAAILFLNNHLGQFLRYIPDFDLTDHRSQIRDPHFAITGILILITTFIGIISGQRNSGKIIITARKVWVWITAALFLTALIYFIFKSENNSVLLLSVLPAAILSGNSFYFAKKKWIAGLWFWMLIMMIWFLNSKIPIHIKWLHI
ncbi:DUF6427 family protein [Rhizosphaericola mali]|uniref:Beta-carotene 15,15'-monooxygenase n=1 Tax=Rhizosphaericola mali TaxID=2545455 RepID=A0A5P2G738_9BACT|nr:DUF6427 family protein [Rhizosphaericola mali]QES87331.1 hypothetical protein E0W69_001190 [Rhizosphaericola mali]